MNRQRLIRVVLVDDHLLLLNSIKRCLKHHERIRVVAAVTTGAEAIETSQKLQPDVVVLDLMLNDASGFEVLREIKRSTRSRVLIVSGISRDLPRMVAWLLEEGASGFVSKMSGKDLATAICQVHEATRPLIEQQLAGDVEKVRDSIEAHRLNEHERAIWRHFKEGFAETEIARKLCLKPSTIHTYIKRIEHKLGVHSRHDLLRMDDVP